MSLRPGDRFGRYEIVALLGSGGMGEVYRARDTVLHREVALKVLHAVPESAGTDGSASQGGARILREARAAAALTHPNAIAVYDVGEADGVPFLAMELVLGKPLRAYVGDSSVTLARRVRWLADVARALGAAHALGLIHRDVKPENILVRADGVAKVLDFGIARHAVAKPDPSAATVAATFTTMTAEGVVVGTPLYMAPEQMRGETLDGRADQFSWGIVAYELLTGALPWNKEQPSLQLVAQILSGAIEAPRARNAEIGPITDTVIRKALSRSPQERFASMDDVAEAIEPEAAAAGPVASGRSRPSIASSPGEVSGHGPTQAMPVSGAHAAPSVGTPLAATTTPNASSRRGWRTAAGVAGGCALALGAWIALRSQSPAGARAAAPDASAPPAVESQMSANAEATAAYRSALQSFRDGALDLATQQFFGAIVLDRAFAAARVHHAMLTDGQISEQLSLNIQRARSQRQSLGEVDRIFLDAMEPWTSSPPDLRESARRLEVAAREHPSNAEIEFQLGWTLHNAFDAEAASRAFDAALARDPTLTAAWCMKGREQARLGDVPGAIETYGRGLAISSGATSCLGNLATLQANQGACSEMAATARRLIAVAPEMPDAYGSLSAALAGEGAPIEAVRSSLRQKWERLPASERKNFQLLDESYLATLAGRFDEAARLDAEFEELVASSSEEVVHLMPAVDRMLLALEEGRPAQARHLAEDYLRRRSSWQVDQLSVDPSIYVYDLVFLAGTGAGADAGLGAARDQWLARDRQRGERSGQTSAAYAGEEWIAARALAATNRDEALAALASRPAGKPVIDDLDVTPLDRYAMGHVDLLAGQIDDAVALMTSASASCAVLSQAVAPWAPVFSTWSAFDLGQALESKGDAAGACRAYQRVLDRWGSAKPASRTADKARARVRALACAR